jgi:hypothetical protein
MMVNIIPHSNYQDKTSTNTILKHPDTILMRSNKFPEMMNKLQKRPDLL